MYLENFTIKKFRGIEHLDLNFNKGLNVLIGENNAGKTSILDALRICLSYGNQRRDIYISHSDFFVDRKVFTDTFEAIEFDLYFHIDDESETAWFNDLLNVREGETSRLELHFRYYLDNKDRVKYKVWGGSKEGQPIAPEALALIYHVYLGALRDAEQYLRPIRGNRLGQLYSKIQLDSDLTLDKSKKKDLAHKVRSAVDEDQSWIDHISKGKVRINEHLEETCFSTKQQQIDISFLPFDFNRLVDNLKIHMPVYSDDLLDDDKTKQKFFEVHQNGLGYNNLIYTATVLGDLKQKKESEKETYIALLIEEPEAHLHPQLQNLFFQYLDKLDTEQGFQIFTTSHSPTITAKANLDSLIVIQNNDHHFHALSLSKSGLLPENKIYLHKFLDVTKSQLFFANGIILVEGISEALLLRVFSKKVDADYDIEKIGIELVNVNGVAFSHFSNLFNNADLSKNLVSRCTLITDDDRSEPDEEGASRIALVKSLEGGSLKVFVGDLTFEYELFKASDSNREILLEIYSGFHPKTKIDTNTDIDQYAFNFANKVKEQKSKSELAMRLANHLEDGEKVSRLFRNIKSFELFLKLFRGLTKEERKSYKDFVRFQVPEYIKDAIVYAVKGK